MPYLPNPNNLEAWRLINLPKPLPLLLQYGYLVGSQAVRLVTGGEPLDTGDWDIMVPPKNWSTLWSAEESFLAGYRGSSTYLGGIHFSFNIPPRSRPGDGSAPDPFSAPLTGSVEVDLFSAYLEEYLAAASLARDKTVVFAVDIPKNIVYSARAFG